MRILQIELQADPKTRDNGKLQNLRHAQWLRDNLCDFDGNSLIIEDTWDWVVTQKAAPYSDKDCMIIYGWENEDVRTLCDCSWEEKMWLQVLLKKVVSGLESHYQEKLESGELQLIIWINTAVEPGAGKAQSVFRPHVHISIFPTSEQTQTAFSVKEWVLENYLKVLGINSENKYLLDSFEKFLLKHNERYEKSMRGAIHHNQTHNALDITLPDNTSIVGGKNTQMMIILYSLLERFTKDFIWSIENRYGVSVNTQWLKFRKNDLSYSLASFRENGKTILRIKFTYRNPLEYGASMEIAGFPISRIPVNNPAFPDMWEFKNTVFWLLGKN